MPKILPIHETMKKRDPRKWDIRGEEGVLFIVPQDDAHYFVKQWYKSHDQKVGIPEKMGISPLSPYWHKVKVYEYKLIHDAFPEHTIDMIGGYDERIQPNPNPSSSEFKYNYSLREGRPTTITREVAQDPILAQQRDAVLKPAYESILGFVDFHAERGIGAKMDNPFFAQWRESVDSAMQRIFGKDIHIPLLRIEYANAAELAQALAKAMRNLAQDLERQQGNTAMVRMLKMGIMPIHPELNFIPGNAQTHTVKPHGTFVELAIRDLNTFTKERSRQLQGKEKEGDLKRMKGLLGRYTLYRNLDSFYDAMGVLGKYPPPKDQWRFDPTVETSFFHVTEALRLGHDRGKILVNEQLRAQLVQAIQEKFARGFSTEHVAILINTEIAGPLLHMAQKA